MRYLSRKHEATFGGGLSFCIHDVILYGFGSKVLSYRLCRRMWAKGRTRGIAQLLSLKARQGKASPHIRRRSRKRVLPGQSYPVQSVSPQVATRSRLMVADHLDYRAGRFVTKYQYYFFMRAHGKKVDSRSRNLLLSQVIQLSLHPHLSNSQTTSIGDRHGEMKEPCFVAHHTSLDVELRRPGRLIGP